MNKNSKQNATVAVIQARTQSTRLPAKILKPFCNGKTMLDFQLACLLNLFDPDQIYIATTTSPADDAIAEKYRDRCKVFRGDETNVLSRFIGVAKTSRARHIVRLASDNPFIFPEGVELMLAAHWEGGGDYTSYAVAGTPAMLTANGLFSEVVSTDTLFSVDVLADRTEKEHVTLSIYTRLKEQFKIRFIDVEATFPLLSNPSLRLTVDTPEDFGMVDTIVRKLNIKGGIDRNAVEKIMALLDRENLMDRMARESKREKNLKVYK